MRLVRRFVAWVIVTFEWFEWAICAHFVGALVLRCIHRFVGDGFVAAVGDVAIRNPCVLSFVGFLFVCHGFLSIKQSGLASALQFVVFDLVA